jgi:competence protein ComEC
MADRGRAGGRAETWVDERAARSRVLPAWPGLAEFLEPARDSLIRWLAADLAPGRLVPWLPVAFGVGIVLYFTADHEPVTFAPVTLALMLAAAAVIARARLIRFAVLLGLTAVACGFATATIKTRLIAHPVLHRIVPSAAITGWVESHEERERTDRIIVRVDHIDAPRLEEALERVRVSVRKRAAPSVGAFVSFKARLNPPLAPLRPGSYDFARDLYFQGIGATGFVSGGIRVIEAPRPAAIRVSYLALIESLRDTIDRRIRAAVPGDAGSIASALITGKQDAISTPVNDALYVSSLAHVLSISGYHMAVVAGVVFFVVRGLLALHPGLALRRPIKKWAALAALAAVTFYLFISGVQVATQRSFYMIAIVLIGVLLDRAAVTFRTLALAALAVLLLAPEAVVHPSFQMSFAATLALVAGYQHGLPFKRARADTSLGGRIALWGVHEIASLLFASLLAGTATTPYAAYHFHRMAPYGVLANLLAMPIISGIAMPAGLAALLLMPFGLDGPLWKLMALGLEWMNSVALWVAHLPGAVGRIAQFGTGPLIVATLGMLVLCLLSSPLRWCGAVLLALACALAVHTPQPDVLIARSGDPIAVRGADGTLAIIRKSGESFAVREWLASDADPRLPADPGLAKRVACDDIGCVARLADGAAVTLALSPEAFEDDCRMAALIVSNHKAPRGCSALVIDRSRRARGGALALRRIDGGWAITPTRLDGFDRPWEPAVTAPKPSLPDATLESGPPAAAASKTPRDATPSAADLEPGD